jgi:hypothetical protein
LCNDAYEVKTFNQSFIFYLEFILNRLAGEVKSLKSETHIYAISRCLVAAPMSVQSSEALICRKLRYFLY